MSTLNLNIFMSYSKYDINQVEKLYDILKHHKFNPWIDEKRLFPGQNWEYEILSNIEKADIILICLSSNSTNKPGFLQKEIKQALEESEKLPENSTFIIPVKLNECTIPEKLRKWQWAEIYHRDGINKLIQSLKHISTVKNSKSDKSYTSNLLDSTVYATSLFEKKIEFTDKKRYDSLIINRESVNDAIITTTGKKQLAKTNINEQPSIQGNYISEGKNNDGTFYKGKAMIQKDGDFFNMTWFINEDTFISKGIVKGDVFKVFGDFEVSYIINDDGSLNGLWGESGSEKLIKY